MPDKLPSGSVLGISGLLMLAFLAVSHARQASPSGEELYVDRLGCWNCHGNDGEGGGGAGARIAKTRLSLREFVKHVRLPSEQMPSYTPAWVSDAELVTLYLWLEGIEAVKIPASVTLSLTRSTHVTADGQRRAEAEVELKARRAETGLNSDVPQATSLRYRVTLAQANTPVAKRMIEYQLTGREGWAKFTTDEQGEALLGPDSGFVLADGATARLRVSLAAGRYALVVEAVDYTKPDSPGVIGIGTAMLKLE